MRPADGATCASLIAMVTSDRTDAAARPPATQSKCPPRVLELLRAGRSDRRIAKKLGISEAQVRQYIRRTTTPVRELGPDRVRSLAADLGLTKP